ncbi:aminoglycoside phosphotransferase family protein [Couchioplanes caeruleus]|uniref:hypothetical protein n=1 Tax=Couchioplanes caeruleus TaxID=56438 RepID=UPI0011609F80|nr:hypothetical protein [Couchioplanes caeruleus]
MPGSPPCAYKEYDATTSAIVDTGTLEDMARFLGDIPPGDANEIRARAAWPTAVVERHGRVSGFLMARVPPAFLVRMRFPSGYHEKLGQVQLLLNDARYLAARDLAVDDRFRLSLLRDTARTLEIFHRLGVVVGDLSPNNLCFSLGPRPRGFFIDCDGMRIHDRTVLPQLETQDWQTPGSGEPLGTTATDSYKFALLCIRLFAGDQSSRDPGVLLRAGTEIHGLAVRGLATDAGGRPSSAEWRTAFDAAVSGRTSVRAGRPHRPTVTAPRTTVRPPRTPQVTPAPPWRTRLAAAAGRYARRRLRTVRPRTAIRLALVVLLVTFGLPRLASIENWWDAAVSAFAADGAQSAAEQASGVARLLATSGRNRAQVVSAVQDVKDCARLSAAVAGLSEASAGRAAALERARNLQTDQLPSGAQLKTQLIGALAHSRAADVAYGKWAEARHNRGCSARTMRTADRDRGDAESREATAAKKRVAALWNPVATRHGHPTVTYLQI